MEESFDRYTRLATRILGLPVALLSLVDEDRQFFKSHCGLLAPLDELRQTPLSHSFCQHVVSTSQSFVVSDARQHPLVKNNLAIPDLGVIAYAGFPVRDADGYVLGSFCAIDGKPRDWTVQDLENLSDLARAVESEIQLRQEVQQRRQAEEELRAAQRLSHALEHQSVMAETLRILLRETPQSIAMLDADLRYIMHSRRWVKDYRLAQEDLVGLSHFEVFPEIKGGYDENFRRVLAGEVLKEDGDSFLRSDGRTEWLSWEMHPWRRGDGSVGGIIMLTEVLTREMEGEALLRESQADVGTAREELQRTVRVLVETQKIANMRGMFWNWDDDRLYYRLSGHGLDNENDHHGLSVETLLDGLAESEKAAARRALAHSKTTLEPLFLSLSRPGKDGATRYYEVRAVAHYDSLGQPNGMVGSLQNLTEQRSLEDQLRQSQKVEWLGQMTAGIAHDFNNLLSVMLGFVDLARESLDSSHPAYEDLGEAQEAGARGSRLVKKLLQFSRRETPEAVEQDVNEILDGMQELLGRLVGSHHGFELECCKERLPLRMDASSLEQLLVNLTANARDAMPTGGTVKVRSRRVTLDAKRPALLGDIPPGTYAVVQVSDTGEGISETMIATIFQPFVTTKGKDKGTGLGLSVCHRIVKQAGGAFDLVTSPAGSRFSVYLPLLEAGSAKTLTCR